METASRIGVVLAGAGARGAYEAGALATLLPVLEANGRRPRFFIGTSAGAINAVLFASLAHLPAAAAAETALALWRQAHREDVLASVPRSSLAAIGRYLGQLAGLPVDLSSLLDPAPLYRTLDRLIDWPQLHENIRHPSRLAGVSVTTTDCASGRTKVFVECSGTRPLPPTDENRAIDYVPARLDSSHLLASAAIPLIFPPAFVTTPAASRGWYLDGGVRLNAPIKPAVALGAERLVLLATTPLEQMPPAPPRAHPQPDVRAALADVLKATLVDRMVEDIRRLGQMNVLLQNLPAGGAGLISRSGRRRRIIPYVFAGPEQADALARLAARVFRHRYGGTGWLRHGLDYPVLHRLLGGAGKVNGELLSYLFFEQEFLAAAVALGQKDARRLIDTSTQQLSWQIHMEEDGRPADLRHDLSRSAQNIRTE